MECPRESVPNVVEEGQEPAQTPKLRKVRKCHGSGSAIARAKVELEKQFAIHLNTLSESAQTIQASMEKQLQIAERTLKLSEEEHLTRKELLKFKKRKLEMKQQLKETEIFDRERRHKDNVEIEQEKLKL